ncbi:MAG: SPFH domain-containing protein [Peptococcaceae bacterium]|jgi:regulator of protease activity HflC (stomatin/prohibitin superfamily)|nr:SPFH domain-containing protein [Peptococcaceae bacterium]
MKTDVQNSGMQEKEMKTLNGFLALGVWILLALGAVLAPMLWGGAGFILSILVGILLIVALPGFAIIRPNEAIVLTLFGKYVGTIKGEGFYWYNPFCVPVRHVGRRGKMSLKAMTLDNGQQKINDELGNPIIIGIVVIWRVTNTAKAAFDVDDYEAYLSTQCDSALRSIVRQYPYDGFNNDAEKSLQGSSLEVAERLQEEIQSKVEMAGLEILEARITHLAYAPEIASAMLQRQQAAAIIDARAMIVDGAVGMVELALKQLENSDMVELDDERKAAMISNLLVVLCANHDAQPIVNSGSLY